MKNNVKNYSRILLLVFALCLTLACLVACNKTEKVDYVSQLTLDMNSSTVKAEVTVKNYVDGDTTHFWAPKEVSKTGVVKARFLAINTPESTGKIEEYGKSASRFTKEKLKSATSIIIESDDENWNTDKNKRHLVWVWYKPQGSDQYRNLNLEILQEGLAIASNTGQSRYGDICLKALAQAEKNKLYVFSDKKDPDMYYGEVQNVSLKELRCNIDAYGGIKVGFEGVIARNYNGSVYVEEYDEETGMYYGISAYYGTAGLSGTGLEMLLEGNRVRLVGTVQYYETADIWQISGLKYDIFDEENPDNMQLLGTGFSGAYPLTTISKFNSKKTVTTQKGGTMEFDYAYLAQNTSISMENLKVKSIYTTTSESSSSQGAMTMTCEDSDGNTIIVRTGVFIRFGGEVVTQDVYENKTINIKGFVDSFDGEYQVKVFAEADITIVG